MKVCVMGLGKLGLPLAGLIAESPEVDHVYGVDPAWDDSIKSDEPGLAELVQNNPKLTATKSLGDVKTSVDIVFVVVPTPSLRNGEFDLVNVANVCDDIVKYQPRCSTVSIVSTVNPGDCQKLRLLFSDEDDEFALLYNPAFVALGAVIDGFRHPDMVLVGTDDFLPNQYMRLMHSVIRYNDEVSPTEVMWVMLKSVEAELAKLAVNTYITMKISFANMIAAACENTKGSDARAVLEAVGTDKRIGHKYLHVGGPYAGPCFPRDNAALRAYIGKVEGTAPALPGAVDRMNEQTKDRILMMAVTVVHSLGLHRIAVLGMSYKANTYVTDAALGPYLEQQLEAFDFEVVTWDRLLHGTAASEFSCVDKDMLTIIANPDPYWTTLAYHDAGAVLDVWDVLNYDADNIFRMGVGYGVL